MTTQSNVSSPIEVAPVRQFSWPLALVILALGVILGILGSNMTAVVGQAEVADVAEQTGRDFPIRPNLLELEKRTIMADAARAQTAEAARYNSLGLFYAAGNEQPALAAETARYKGLADYYEADRQPALAAETARYEGMTEYYGAVAEPRSLAWPPRPNQFFLKKNGIESDPNADIGLME
ncbi:MAG: hypothetical protein Fur0044_53840 [Anaerolineae bacterium]|nr:hypothetical protein [Anaerolineales bacterium]MCQ3975615.1 hypothetical protein [Anaerolineae bacterium]